MVSLILCGCSLKKEKEYQGNMNIPQNGIVEKTVFSQIKENNAVVTFSGESNGCKYEWVVFGDDIENPQDINLAVEITEEPEKVLLDFQSDDYFGFSSVLSIHLNSVWDCQNAVVYDNKNNAVCGASVTGSENTILNYTVLQTTGTFCIMPNKSDDSKSSVISEKEKEITTENKISTVKTNEQDDYLTPAGQVSGNAVSIDNNSNIIKEITTENKISTVKTNEQNDYLTPAEQISDNIISDEINNSELSDYDDRIISDGSQTEQDKYLTDPVPEGKPMPVEPENAEINEQNQYTCTFSVECSTILNNLDELNPEKFDVLPADGIIFPATEVVFYEGESVYDVLQRICRENNIHMEASWTPMYNSAYVEGIHNLYEFDCGNLSGWMYRVDGWYPNYGCSRYQLKDGETVEWRYTCDLGNDVGGGYAVTGGE